MPVRLPLVEATRQNHAIEHATIEILLHRLPSGTRMAGRSTPAGFYVYGNVPTDQLRLAAEEGLRRLQGGEAELAISALCGTNVAMAGVLAGLGSFLAFGRQRRIDSLQRLILVSTLAVLASQPLGRLAQRHVTTSPHVGNVRIAGITRRAIGRFVFHRVDTTRSTAAQPLTL
jgi:hypothetical protein